MTLQLNTSLITALAAGVVSLTALAVSIYEAYLMRQQQHAAVWPIMEHWTSYGPGRFEIVVANKGLGPAMVGQVSVEMNGTPMNNWPEVFRAALGDKAVHFSQSMLAGNVMAPDETATLLAYPEDTATAAWHASRQITLNVCYCSVFGDCWVYRARDLVGGRPVREEVRDCPSGETGEF